MLQPHLRRVKQLHAVAAWHLQHCQRVRGEAEVARSEGLWPHAGCFWAAQVATLPREDHQACSQVGGRTVEGMRASGSCMAAT